MSQPVIRAQLCSPTSISWLMFLWVAKHSGACLMGRRPSFLHGREVGPAAFGGAAAVPRSGSTSGSYQRGDGGRRGPRKRATDGRRDKRQSETKR